MSDLYLRVCDPMQPHRKLENGSECGVDCFVRVDVPAYTVDLNGAIGSHLLLWITDPGTTETEDSLIHRFELEEVAVS